MESCRQMSRDWGGNMWGVTVIWGSIIIKVIIYFLYDFRSCIAKYQLWCIMNCLYLKTCSMLLFSLSEYLISSLLILFSMIGGFSAQLSSAIFEFQFSLYSFVEFSFPSLLSSLYYSCFISLPLRFLSLFLLPIFLLPILLLLFFFTPFPILHFQFSPPPSFFHLVVFSHYY